jgi:catechol 2,3-dioxygenase-like lactoylglutathione lyase family enzyme
MRALALLALATSAFAQTHFHHVHLNSANPAAAIDWYTLHLAAEKAKFGNADALWTQSSWILFNKVNQPPPYDVVSSLYHIGWGAEDMKAEFVRQIQIGTTYQTPLTDAAEVFGGNNRDRSFFMYLYGPDKIMIEVQSAQHHNFMHLHMLSDDPVAAATWYEQHLGITARTKAPAERAFRGLPTGPMGISQLDAVSIIWYPTAHAKALFGGEWIGRKQYASPRGRVIDHIGVSVDSLDQTIARLRMEGVKILAEPKTVNGLRSAFVQAPDNVELEIVEGHPKR